MKKLLFIPILLLPIAVFAHAGATGAVKLRMDGMKAIGAALKTLAEQSKADASDFDAAKTAAAAATLAQHSTDIPVTFEEKDLSHPSEAAPEIWTDWNAFLEIAARMEADALKARDAKSAEELRPLVAALGESCKSCHEAYRVKK